MSAVFDDASELTLNRLRLTRAADPTETLDLIEAVRRPAGVARR